MPSTISFEDISAEGNDGDEHCRSAKDLAMNEIRKELEDRGISATGFWSDDAKKLQIEFDREFEEQAVEREKRKVIKDQERKLQALERASKATLQREAREEALELQHNSKISMFLNLVSENAAPSHVALVCDSILVRAIAKNMLTSKCNTIISLDLPRCDLNDDAGKHLARMIGSKSCSIQLLNLELNNMGPAAASAFGEHLKTNTSLKYLTLEGNNLTNSEEDMSGISALADSLRFNSNLINLNLWRCAVGGEGSQFFSNALEKNNTLLTLDIGGSSALVSELQKISKSLLRNKEINDHNNVLMRKERKEKKRQDAEAKMEEEKERLKKEENEWIEAEREKRAKERQRIKDEEKRIAEEARLKREEEERIRKAEEEAKLKEAEEKKKKKGKGKKK